MDEIKEISTIINHPITLLGVGAIIGFILSLAKDFFNYFIQSKKIKKDLALKRLDEIFCLLSQNYSSAIKVYARSIGSESSDESFNNATSKIAFSIRVHFPDLHKQYSEYISKTSNYMTIQIQASDDKSILGSDEYKNIQKDFTSTYGDMCTAIVEKAKEYN